MKYYGEVIDSETFLNKFNILHDNLHLITNFEKRRKKVYVSDEFGGIYKVFPADLLNGSKPKASSCINIKEWFINKCAILHKNKYSYSLVDIKDKKDTVDIICKQHGVFSQKAYSHLNGNGCQKCFLNKNGKNRTTTFSTFKDKANQIHNFNYEYIEEGYINVNNILQIKCPIHGIFKQKGYSHLQGKGCRNCANEIYGGYKLKDWIRMGEVSKNFTSYKVYIVKLYSEDEEFIKIGKTFTEISHRMRAIPYKYEVLKVIKGSAEYVHHKEIELHRKFIKYKYPPKNLFQGHTECFNIKIQYEKLQ